MNQSKSEQDADDGLNIIEAIRNAEDEYQIGFNCPGTNLNYFTVDNLRMLLPYSFNTMKIIEMIVQTNNDISVN